MVETDEVMGMDPIQTSLAVWGPSIDGPEIRRLQSRYQGHVTEEEWDGVVETAASILGRCPNPVGSERRITGLVLGKIQSGKTLSYTALIALAIDNGYRITVVLAGTKNPLLAQNYARLCQDLDAQRPSITPFRNPLPQDAEVIQGVLHGQGHALIVVLKNRGRLDGVRRLLATPELRAIPTLIIDDEGDEASLNTQFRRGRQSAIYQSILSLRQALRTHAYIAYTATPQANLLISGIDGLSPDFGVMVEPGGGYCGGETFFGDDRDNYVRIVPLSETEDGDASGIPDGLRQALATFLVGSAVRHLREANAWHSMLIHNSNLRVDHGRLQVSVRNLMAQWRERLALPGEDPAAQELVDNLKAAYDDICITVLNPPPWGEIVERLHDEIRFVEVWMVNSLPLGRDPIATPFRLQNNILVGGNMLGRGVTIEGLAVTYITRRAQNETNADTMEQRARWFGYKQSYLDLCRIFVSRQLRDDYTELLRHEEDFWEALRRNQRQGLSIRDWPRMLTLDANMGLRPTRSNVARYRRFRGGGWDVQNRLVEDNHVAASNVEIVRSFFERYPGTTRRFGNVEHVVVEGCQTEVVISELLGTVQTDGTDWEGAYTVEYLARLLLDGSLPSVNVLYATGGQARIRTKRNGRVNPMQGRSPSRDAADPGFYPGDENINNGNVQLQVHIIRVQGDPGDYPVETTAFALYVPPDDPRFDLAYVVRDELNEP